MKTILRIGPIDYVVEEVPDLRDGDKKLNGWIRYNECEILLEESMAPSVKRVVLWHEIVHGILTNADVNSDDERLVDVLAYGIADVLRNNPEMLNLGD